MSIEDANDPNNNEVQPGTPVPPVIDGATIAAYTVESPSRNTEAETLTRERLQDLATLSIEVTNDLHDLLAAINERLGTNMEPREDGNHITVISPTESKVLRTLSEEQIKDLQEINRSIQAGEGVSVNGIGYIDGSSHSNLLEVDQTKRTCFISLSIPTLNAFRASLGLPPEKDFHVTLGFEGGDIHTKIAGKNEKGKPILQPISKQADEAFADMALPSLKFSRLSGKEKQSKAL